ncbi:MAG: hypothetical protein AAB696_01130 [Patescibacteria group bacterium]
MTILIKNIQLIDGAGKPPVKTDVLIKKEKIHAIGSFPRYQANEIIDGMGAYLAPGFIDINNESDHYLTIFSDPSANSGQVLSQKDFLLRGFTTIIGGQGGSSLAPLLYGSLESIKEWADIKKINVNWRTVAEFLKVMEQRRLGVNFGTLIGHYTIRQALTGGAERDLSRNELRVFNHILEKSFKEGAFGFSTGLNYIQSRQTSYSEIKALVETCAKYKRLYASNLRDEKRGLLSSVNEIIEIAKETGVKVLINNFKPIIGYGKNYEESLELINKNSDKADIHFSVYPTDTNAILVYEFLPEWVKKDGNEIMLKDIQSPGLREKILKELPRVKGGEVVILNAPDNKYLIGKSLKEFAQNRGLTIGEGLLELMKITNFRATVSYKNISFKKTIQSLVDERAIAVSDNAGEFLKLAEKSPEKFIYKITGLPAEKLGLKNRGLIREGYFADLVIFRDAKIREVFLNGKRVVKSGVFQNVLAGKILRKN